MKIEKITAALGALASLTAASFWISSSMINIPNNLDTFIEALQLASRLSGYAALAAAAAAFCGLFLCYRQWNDSVWTD